MPRRANNSSPAAALTSAMGIVPIDLLDAVVIEEVSDALWKRVFDLLGYPPGLNARSLSAQAVVDHIARDGVSDDLVDVLRAIHELGTDDGVDAMKAVADAHNADLGAITARAPRDAAVELWLAQREKPGLRDLFTRVQMQAESRRSPRSFREFRGKRVQKLAAWATVHPRLVTAVRAWCTAQDFGDHVDVRGYVENGNAQIQIIHGHRLQKPVVVKDGGHGRRTLELRPAHCDIVRYDWKGSWLRLSPKSTGGGIVETYRRRLGEVFFDDAEFFTEADYSLRPLQEHGQAILDDAPSIARARVTDLVWDHGGEIIRIRSSDCLASVARMGIPPTEGDFIEARIAVVLPGRREVRRSVHVKVPNKVDYPRDESHAVAIDDFLAATGIRTADSRRRNLDLWDLHPWQHGERVWRAAYPDDVDRLAQAQVLRPVELGTLVHPDRPRHGRALRAEDGFGISLDEDVPPRVLTSTDVSGLALDASSPLRPPATSPTPTTSISAASPAPGATAAEEDARLPPLPGGVGNAIMETFRLPPSRLIGDLKRYLEEQVATGALEARREDAYYVAHLARSGRVPGLEPEEAARIAGAGGLDDEAAAAALDAERAGDLAGPAPEVEPEDHDGDPERPHDGPAPCGADGEGGGGHGHGHGHDGGDDGGDDDDPAAVGEVDPDGHRH